MNAVTRHSGNIVSNALTVDCLRYFYSAGSAEAVTSKVFPAVSWANPAVDAAASTTILDAVWDFSVVASNVFSATS